MEKFKKIGDNGILELADKKIIFNGRTMEIGYCDKNKSDEDLVSEFESAVDGEGEKIEKNNNLMLRILMTANCNLKCEYCQMRLLNDTVFKEDIGYCDLDEIVSKISSSNYDFITIHFSGGEPLLAIKKIEYLGEELKKSGLTNVKLAISTNGLLMNDKVIEILKKYDIQTVVSIDGDEEMNKNRVTKGNKSSYKSVLNSCRKASDQGLNIGVSMVYSNQNESIRDFIKNIIDKYHIKSLGFNYLHYSGFKKDDNGQEYMKRYIDTLYDIYKICRDADVFEEQSNRMLEPLVTGIPRTRHCSSQSSQVTVAPNKTISPCKTFCSGQKDTCDLSDWINNTDRYKEIFDYWRERSNETVSKCSECLVRNMCGGGCCYEAYVDNGDIYTPDEKYCIVPYTFLEKVIYDLDEHGVFNDYDNSVKLVSSESKKYLASSTKVKKKKLTTSIGHYLEN